MSPKTRRVPPQLRMVCPYCYTRFLRWQILFQCTGKPSRGAATCMPRPDQAYSAQFGAELPDGTRQSVDLLPVFPARRRHTAVHEPCRLETSYRVCPHCHHRLPADFERVRSRVIALVGSRSSGKTVLLTTLIRELKDDDGIGARVGITAWEADDDTRREYAILERMLYVDNEVPAGTTPGQRAPLVFTIVQRDANRRRRWTLLSFFDSAGEDLRSTEGVERNTTYLKSADAVLLLLDPGQIESGLRHDDRSGGPNREESFAVLRQITDFMKQGSGKQSVAKPMAVVVSKIDLWREDIDPLSPLRSAPPELGGFARRDGSDVHGAVRELLRERGGRLTDQYLEDHYRNFHYFGVSALGHAPDGAQVGQAGVLPYRITEPFLWLLAQLRSGRTIEDD